MLRFQLFGPVRAYVGDQLVIDEQFTRRVAKALLVLLYLNRGRYVSKDELFETLWPRLDQPRPDSGRLKQTVFVLRRALEGERSRQTGWRFILERDGAYGFNTRMPCSSDLEEFRQELWRAHSDQQLGDREAALIHFHRAFAVHCAELLPEFRYEEWARGEITETREQYLQALEDSARLHGAGREYSQAVELLKRAIREDPLRESSTRQLMEWLWRKGEPTEALRAYGRLQEVLARRLQLEPEPTVTALYEAIRRNRAAG
jgi:LuxR family transcriptional regulator, maltose regulon positive regulatory protein